LQKVQIIFTDGCAREYELDEEVAKLQLVDTSEGFRVIGRIERFSLPGAGPGLDVQPDGGRVAEVRG
jgi:hypothetical protein